MIERLIVGMAVGVRRIEIDQINILQSWHQVKYIFIKAAVLFSIVKDGAIIFGQQFEKDFSDGLRDARIAFDARLISGVSKSLCVREMPHDDFPRQSAI